MLKTETYILYTSIGFILFVTYGWLVFKYVALSSKLDRVTKVLQDLHEKIFGPSSEVLADRNEKRFKYRAKSRLTGAVSKDGQTFPVDILDVSKTGALIQSVGLTLNLGEVYDFAFALDEKNELSLSIRPVRVSEEKPSTYGVLFQNASISTLREIANYVSSSAQNEVSSPFDPHNV